MTQPATVASERALLSRHLSWCARQPWVDKMYDELTRLLAQLRHTNGTAAPRPLARCHHCNGPIHVDEASGGARCGTCGETWTGAQLAAMHAVVEEARRPRTDDGRAMLTVAEMVAKYGASANAVRVKLHRAGVKGIDGYYDAAVFEGVA